MKRTWIAVMGVVLLAGAPLYAEEPAALQTPTDKESYSAGVEIVRSLMRQGGAVNLDIVIQGMKDGLTGQGLLMTEEELRMALAARQAGAAPKQAAVKSGEQKTMDAGRQDLPATPLKRDVQPMRSDEAGAEGQLASANNTPAAGATMAGITPGITPGNGASGAEMMQSGPSRQGAPMLSRRNQARLDVQSLKAEMRARALAGQ